MVDWFGLFKKPFSDDRRSSNGMRRVGRLAARSGSIVLGEIQWPPDLAVSGIQTTAVEVFVKTWDNRVAELVLSMGPKTSICSRRLVGQIGIDSAKMLVADKEAVAEHW